MSDAESLIEQLRGASVDRARAAAHHGNSGYTGSPHTALGITVPVMRRLARAWLAQHRTLPAEAIVQVADGLLMHISSPVR